MDLDTANLLVAVISVGVALLTALLGGFAFMWKMNRDLDAKLDRRCDGLDDKVDKLNNKLDKRCDDLDAKLGKLDDKLDKQQEQHRTDMEKLRVELREEFSQFREEVLADIRELREQVFKLWQHIQNLRES